MIPHVLELTTGDTTVATTVRINGTKIGMLEEVGITFDANYTRPRILIKGHESGEAFMDLYNQYKEATKDSQNVGIPLRINEGKESFAFLHMEVTKYAEPVDTETPS